MQTAVFLPPFGELSDPRVVAELAAAAEEAGWDGFFVWDHILYRPPTLPVADAWVCMAALAAATTRIRFGPMVTPLPRRRPQVVARQCVALDQLSNGRLIFGAGLGQDNSGEFSRFADETDPKVHRDRLEAGLGFLESAWGGELLPAPVQQPRIPIWLGAVWPNKRPIRRALRYDGVFPVAIRDPQEVADLVAFVAGERGSVDGFDIAVQGGPDVDPAPYVEAGATWWLVRVDHAGGLAAARATIAARP